MAGDQAQSNQFIDVITEQDMATVAQRVVGDKSVSVLKHRFDSYSGQVLGMLGSHRILTMTIRRKDNDVPEEIDLFVKSVPYENPSQASFIISQGIFAKESLFFQQAIPFLVQNYKNDKWTADCYLAKKDALIMSNLRSQGYKLLGTFHDNLPAIKSVFATLARFHSCSILAEARLKQMNESVDTLDKYWPDLLNETMFTTNGGSSVWVESSIKAATTVAEMYGHDPERIRSACTKIYEIILPSEIHCNVICHGDLWTNNIMIDDRSQPYKCVLVDFQLIRYAPLVLDILQLLHVNASRNFRQKFERTLVDYYHLILEEAIKSHDLVGKTKTVTIDDILTGLENYRLFGAIVACFYRLLGPKVAAKCAESPEQYAKFLSGDVIEVIRLFMEKDELYKNQVEDAINELADISKQI